MAHTRVGVSILETLTLGMYTNPLDALREYIQNAMDAMAAADRRGLVPMKDAGVDIVVDSGTRSVVIRDEGTGIARHEVAEKLLSLGISDKAFGVDAGFRGIGRLAGIAYCSTLVFRTSSLGEGFTSTVRVDCQALADAMAPRNRESSDLVDMLTRHSETSESACGTEEHFFEVHLVGVKQSAGVLLDRTALETYLRQVAPVDYDAQRFVYKHQLRSWLSDRAIPLRSVRVFLTHDETRREIFKPYKTKYKTMAKGQEFEFDVRGLRMFPEDAGPESDFWLWYGESDLLGMITDATAAGLRFRMNNIAIDGPEGMAELFGKLAESNQRFNSYLIGEIHILNQSVIPNARRDGFEGTPEWEAIQAQLMAFASQRCSEIRAASEARNRPATKVVTFARRLIDDVDRQLEAGIASRDERDALVGKVARERERAEAALTAKGRSDGDVALITPAIQELQKREQQLTAMTTFALKHIRSDMSRKERKVIQVVLETLKAVLADRDYTTAKAAIIAKFQIAERDA